MVKNPPANAGDTGDLGLILGLGRYPGGGNGNPLQYSRLGNPMDRGAWWAIVKGMAKSQTQLSIYMHIYTYLYTHIHKSSYIVYLYTLYRYRLNKDIHLSL